MDVFALTPESRAYFRQAAVSAAYELGLFDTPPGAGTRRLRALCDVLVLEGALRRDGERLAVGRVGPRPEPVLGAFGRLAEVIRRDRPVDDYRDDAAVRHRLHDHLADAGAAPARELAVRLAPLVGEGSFLDAGGGAGAYTAALLDAALGAKATLVDLAPVVELAREKLRGRRVQFVAGDLRDVDLGAGHRAALCVNVLHHHGPETCARILERIARSLAPDGWLVVKDFDVAADRSGPAESLYFALAMALFTEEGDVYAPSEIASWLPGMETRIERLDCAPESFVLFARASAGAAR